MTTPSTNAVARPAAATWGWVLRRAMLGLLILTVSVAGAAWLLHSTIDPAEEARAASAAQQAAEGPGRATESR